MFSPMMLFDVIFGTLSSYIAFKLMQRAKNLYIASIFPVLLVSVPALGTWLYLASDEVFFVLLMQFMLSEFVMVSIIGVLLFKILEKNEGFMSYIYNF